MKKRTILIFIAAVLSIMLSSCAASTGVKPDTETQTQTRTEAVTAQSEETAAKAESTEAASTAPIETEEAETEPVIVSYKTDSGEYNWDETKIFSPYGMGFEDYCEEHYSGYHSIPGELYNIVKNFYGEAEFERRMASATVGVPRYDKNGHCLGFNIKTFIDIFEVSREAFDECIDLTSNAHYDLDLLFSDDPSAVDDYYRHMTYLNRCSSRESNYQSILNYIRDNGGANYMSSAGYERTHFYSVPEAAYVMGFDYDELYAIITEAQRLNFKNAAINGKFIGFDYDFSVIYNEDGSFKEDLRKIDLSVQHIDDETLKKASISLGEEFCRVYEREDITPYADDFSEVKHPRGQDVPGSINCYADDWMLYSCASVLIDYVKQNYSNIDDETVEALWEWDDPLQMRKIIEKYQIPREVFEEIVYFVNYPDIDIDLIYNATDEELEAYYLDVEARTRDHFKVHSFKNVCLFLKMYYIPEMYHQMNTFDCLPRMIQRAEISREEFEAILEEVKKWDEGARIYFAGEYTRYDYDLDMIYNEDGSFKELPDLDGNADNSTQLSYTDFDSDTNKEIMELNEMFCRVGKYAE